MVTIPPSPSKSSITVGWGRRHNDGDTTTTANEGISAFPNALGRGQPFLLVYLPFWLGEGPVSSVSCRHGAFIVSCSCAGTIAETSFVRINGISMVVNIAFKNSTENS